MNQTDNKSAIEILKRYEDLEPLQAGADWEQRLLTRIKSSRSTSGYKKEWLRYSAFIIMVLVLNTFLVFRAEKENSGSNGQRTEMLNTVSDQLLIHSTALK